MALSQSSGEETTSKVIFAGPCAVTGIWLISDGTNDPKVILHDNETEASGIVKAEAGFDVSLRLTHEHYSMPEVEFLNGIFATISGTDASYIIEYEPGT